MASSFGIFLKSERESKGLLQDDIAKSLGTTRAYISNIENGVRFPSEKQLDAFSRAYKIPIEELKKRWVEVKAGRVAEKVGIGTSYQFDIAKAPQAETLRQAETKLQQVLKEVRSMLGEKSECDFVKIPILGLAPAGDIIEVDQTAGEVLTLPQSQVIRSHRLFALRADGVSMEEAGIKTGDIVVFDSDDEPDDGDIVLAATPDGITMKYFYKKEKYVELRPASKTFKKVYKLREVRVQGKLVYHIKKY